MTGTAQAAPATTRRRATASGMLTSTYFLRDPTGPCCPRSVRARPTLGPQEGTSLRFLYQCMPSARGLSVRLTTVSHQRTTRDDAGVSARWDGHALRITRQDDPALGRRGPPRPRAPPLHRADDPRGPRHTARG